MASDKKNILISSLEIMLMSIGVLSIAILILNSVTYNIPFIITTLRSWLQPPYLHLITNAIIITIVASSRLHHHHHHNNHHDKVASPLPPPHHHQHNNHHDVTPYGVVSIKDVEVDEVVGRFVGNYEIKNSIAYYNDDKDVEIKESINDDKKSMVLEQSTWTPPNKSPPLRRQHALEKVSPEFLSERSLSMPRFSHHHYRRPSKTNQADEGEKALKVSKPQKHDTLDNIWKAITQKNHIPLTYTWEHQDRPIDLLNESTPYPTAMKKYKTFYERTNYVSPPVTSTKLKKEPSLSHDELNRRVEAFINKFNEEMRLERQQSMQQYMEI